MVLNYFSADVVRLAVSLYALTQKATIGENPPAGVARLR